MESRDGNRLCAEGWGLMGKGGDMTTEYRDALVDTAMRNAGFIKEPFGGGHCWTITSGDSAVRIMFNENEAYGSPFARGWQWAGFYHDRPDGGRAGIRMRRAIGQALEHLPKQRSSGDR